MDLTDEIIVPTSAQDELFRMAVRNFVNSAPNHRKVLASSRFSPTIVDIDNWIDGKDLPELTMRSWMMDFIWNHYCNCTCNGDCN